jgi:small-conductance mechanosensitive channel
MAAKDDFDILDAAVKSGKQSVTLPDGRTFNLDEARTERDRLGKELKKKETATETEESIKAQQIKNAEKIVKNRESLLTQTLRAFSKNNASAEQVKKAQDDLRNASEFLARLTSQTVVTAPATATALRLLGSAAGFGESEEQALARVALSRRR